jgi:homoserine kinase type II
MTGMNDAKLEKLLSAWGLVYLRRREDMPVSGSPDRCLFRVVVEDAEADIFVLERIAPEKFSRRRKMAEVLDRLRERGLSGIQAYVPDRRGDHVVCLEGEGWQLGRFIHGIPLERPEYVFDGWRGRRLGRFLVDLNAAALPGLPLGDPDTFSIMRFIDDLADRTARRDPSVRKEIDEILLFLQADFRKVHDALPVRFSHGDLHPMNVIWSERDFACVIDWEFMGIKAEIYDAANLIGCIGMENPAGLTGPLVLAFLPAVRRSNALSSLSLRYLPEAVIALRFAWLSEWLRQRDGEMIELEIIYLKLLARNRDLLREVWLTETGSPTGPP